MSLVVWLPLNGNSKNQGTKQYKETMNTLEYTSNGKTTNKCMNLGRLQYDKNPLGMVGSICFWIYPKSADEGGNGKSQIIFGRNDSGIGERKWSLYLFSHQPSVVPHNTSLHSWGCQKDGSKDPNGDFTLTGVLKESAWNHVCVAHDLDYEYVYINGILKNKTEWDSNGTFTFDVGTPIIYGDYNNYESNYRLNDFRIYNHCLTQSEVSEIAKGLMLHYSFENPYVMETTNIPHSLTLTTDKVTMGTDDIGKYITKPTGLHWYDGLKLSYISVKPGRYYTWSIDIMTTEDCYYMFDTNAGCSSAAHTGNDMHFIGGKSIRSSEDIITTWDDGTISTTGKLEAYKWKRAWTTVKIHSECSNPFIWHSICPIATDKSVKMYYKNSMVEESPYPSPYTSSNREAGLIRDNSGMGNDGTQVYQREEIPITPKTQTTSSSVPQYGGYTNVYDSNLKTYTINNFSGADNQTGMLGTIKYLSRYHYLNSKICYEFDIKLQDITVTDGKTIRILQQGPTVFKDDTCRWLSSPVQGVDITSRLNNGATGVYHVCIERIIDNTDCVTNADYYEFGLRFDYVKSGTVTVSNLHAYYGSLDTSTLSLSDNSALGTHSAYFNGKNYIDCGLVTPLEIDEMTLSCWAYRDDWSTLSLGGLYDSALISSVNAGGFGFKLERCAQESIDKSINFVIYYKDAGYLERVKSYGMAIDYTKLSSGWHLITGVATRNKAILYIDGEKVRECIHNLNKPIYNYDTTNKKRNNLLVGAECETITSPPTALGVYIDDVRLYSTALSSKDIKALYNVKTRIDNKSNLYCNQLVETKSENMMKPLNKVDLSTIYGFNSTGTVTYSNGIIKYLAGSTNPKSNNSGMFLGNVNYGGSLLDNVKYRCEFYVRVSKQATYLLGEERLGPVQKTLESGKWYHIKQEGTAININKNFIFYNRSNNFVPGDTIEVRDIQIYRLYDDENYNPGPNIKGQYKTFELNETFNEDVENSGATIVDKYGAEWLEVFYHNTNNNTVWFTDEAEALHTNSQYKFSILDQLENFRNSDGKFEFLLEYPTDFPNEYNRWKQTDNPTKVTEVVNNDTASTIFANGYEAIHIDWLGNYWGGLLRSSTDETYIDGSVGHTNWFYAIGCYNNTNDGSWSNHLPGPNGSSVNEVNLYVRIDNLPNKNKIFRQYKRQTKTKEIIEI